MIWIWRGQASACTQGSLLGGSVNQIEKVSQIGSVRQVGEMIKETLETTAYFAWLD